MAIQLDNIQGIGKKLQDKILLYFNDDEDSAIKALKNCMGGVIPGISQKQAIKFARIIFEKENQASLDDILKTDAIKSIYEDVIEIISEYFISEYSQNKISLYFPLGPENIDMIRERNDTFQKAITFFHKYGAEFKKKGLNKHLEKLSLLKQNGTDKKIRNRCIVTDSQKVLDALKEDDIHKVISVEKVNTDKIKDADTYFKQYADSFETVILITDNVSILPDLMNVVCLDTKEMCEESIIPERIINYFSNNSKIIDAIYHISELLQSVDKIDQKLIKNFLDILNPENIEVLQQNTKILDDDGNIASTYDENLDQYRQDAIKFAGIVIEAENLINDGIKDEVNSSAITIEGEKILDLFRSDFSMDRMRQFVPTEVEDLIQAKIEEGISDLEKTLHLTKQEKSWTDELFPEEIEIPISLNYIGVDKLEFNIKKRASVYSYNIIRDIAEQLKEHQNYLNELIWIMLEFEFFYAIGNFASDYGLSIPKIVEKKHGISFKDAYNLNLMKNSLETGQKTVPISYVIGNIPFDPIQPSRINLLSGSNSGGKTMCLYTIAHSLILAQMGFPTPGKVEYYPFSEMYFFKKSSGQLSAGAFETTLLNFVDLANSPKEKLVLADELEAITEPNAAAKVIGALFSLLLENSNNYAVFVTHLIELLLENLNEKEKKQVRVDGIEATGLDKNLELIIDRNPKFCYIARSTPELILERLSKKGKNNQKDFFSKILNKFGHA